MECMFAAVMTNICVNAVNMFCRPRITSGHPALFWILILTIFHCRMFPQRSHVASKRLPPCNNRAQCVQRVLMYILSERIERVLTHNQSNLHIDAHGCHFRPVCTHQIGRRWLPLCSRKSVRVAAL